MNETKPESTVEEALERARTHSPFLRLQLERFPEIAASLAAGDFEAALAAARGQGEGEDLAAALRRERSARALALGVGDLAGALPLERVMEELSGLAERSLERALAGAFAERTPDAAPRGFAIIGLGK